MNVKKDKDKDSDSDIHDMFNNCGNDHESDYDPHIIIFFGEINDENTQKLTGQLLLSEKTINRNMKNFKRKYDTMKNDNDSITMTYSSKPIKLYITTDGGCLLCAFSLIDTIKSLSVKVHTICKGAVSSAGTLICMAGEKKFISKNSYMLIHELRNGCWGKFSKLVDSHENSVQFMEHVKHYYVENSKIPENEIAEILKKDLYWNANKCLELGLVHEII